MVKVKAGPHRGERGTVKQIDEQKLSICLDDSRIVIQVTPEDVTNFSLAARKAWVTDPNRGVGRRKGTCLTDRVSVTLRFDRDLWELFQRLEKAGIIEDRTAIINAWFREKLTTLDDERKI